MKNPQADRVINLWWDINNHIMVFFGKEKEDVIYYFINKCYDRDGQKKKIKKRYKELGYRFTK